MKAEYWGMLGVGFIFGMVFNLFLLSMVEDNRYRHDGYFQGQVDALNGKITVALVKQPDNSSKWERKNENKK